MPKINCNCNWQWNWRDLSEYETPCDGASPCTLGSMKKKSVECKRDCRDSSEYETPCDGGPTCKNRKPVDDMKTPEFGPCGCVDCHPVSKLGNRINGKKFPGFENGSILPHRTKTRRKCRSVPKEHQPALTCPHRQKCLGYKHSCNTGHYATESKDTCTMFWEAFYAGNEAGERMINDTIHTVTTNRSSLERLKIRIQTLLTETATEPRTELNSWHLGFWHGALRRL
uniref:Uncharacterized protein n=1 Tax=Lobelia fenshamii TaxID=2010899 RepID=A0A1Z2R300_9ASTR|nr:hypothetical protein Lo_spn1Pt0115 [Lobelia fenshamii]